MNRFANNPLSFLQFVFILAGIQISVAILSVPRELSRAAGTDGWMAIILGWLITLVPSILIVRIMRRGPDGTVLDLMRRTLGKWPALVFTAAVALYLAALAYIGLLRTLLIVRVWLLQNTSPFMILLLLLIPTYIAASEGPKLFGRYAEGIFYLLFWLPFVYLLPVKEGHWLNIQPLFKEGFGAIVSAVPSAIFAYVGFIAAFFLFPYLKNKKHAELGIALASTITMSINLLITLVCFVYFSPSEIMEINQPVITVLKTIQFKFVERIEVIFISLFIAIYSLIWVPCLNLTAYCLNWANDRIAERNYLRILLGILAVGTYFYIPTFIQSDQMEHSLTKAGLIIEYAFPVAFWLYLKARDGFLGEGRSG